MGRARVVNVCTRSQTPTRRWWHTRALMHCVLMVWVDGREATSKKAALPRPRACNHKAGRIWAVGLAVRQFTLARQPQEACLRKPRHIEQRLSCDVARCASQRCYYYLPGTPCCCCAGSQERECAMLHADRARNMAGSRACTCSKHTYPVPRYSVASARARCPAPDDNTTTPQPPPPSLLPPGAETGAGGRMRDTHATGTGSIMGAGEQRRVCWLELNAPCLLLPA